MQLLYGSIRRLLFVPWALGDHDGYVEMLRERGLDGGYELVGIHRAQDARAAVEEAEGIYVGGGNTFRLVSELHRHDLVDLVHERVLKGLPYAGVSAGTNIAAPTLMTTNDMPIVMPPSFDTLGLVPFQINPHYFSGSTWVKTDGEPIEHFGETRDQRLAEFHELNNVPVIGLWEGAALRVEGDRMQLVDGPARLFRRGQDALDLAPGTSLAVDGLA